MTLRPTEVILKVPFVLRKAAPAAALLLAASAVLAQAKPLQTRPDPNAPPIVAVPDRTQAYYHEGLAHLYEDMAVSNGRPDYASQAIEEYKLALGADPTSKYLQDGLPDLYFRVGRIREAINAAQEQIKTDPNDIAAHTLLGKVYLRSLGDMTGAQAGEMLQLAIGEYEKLAVLKPKDLETHLLLGQLYGLNHDSAKAEAQFKIAQSLDGNSEDVVLNMARLYAEQGQVQQAVDVLSAIPPDDRGSRTNLALGAAYDQLKQPKKAAAAYKAALDDEPDNPDTVRALAAALLQDNQLAEAKTAYLQLLQNDPNDLQATVKVIEIDRQQGKYTDGIAALKKAKTLPGAGDDLELSYEEAILYDSAGQYDEAAASLQSLLSATASSAGRPYGEQEKSNRASFLDRLAVIYQEENKTTEAAATYQEMIELGGDYALAGYQGKVNTYNQGHELKLADDTAAAAAKAYPGNSNVQLLYAFQLAVDGKADAGLKLANAQLNGTPQDEDTHYKIANIDLELHRTADAVAELAKADAMADKPEQHLAIDLMRATVYDRDKQYDAAEAEYRKALVIDPDNATVLNDLGYMYADRNVHLDDALKMLQKAVALEPTNGSFLDSLGWVYFRLGQYGPAEDNLHKAIERSPTDASIHDHLGQVYAKSGRLQLAVAQWERSMSEYAHTLPADADPADIAKVKRELDEARIKLARNGQASGKKS